MAQPSTTILELVWVVPAVLPRLSPTRTMMGW